MAKVITAFCAVCQAKTPHTVTYDVDANGNEMPVFKLTCKNSTEEVEHAIRMSAGATKDEVERILADHEATFKGKPAEEPEGQLITQDPAKIDNLF